MNIIASCSFLVIVSFLVTSSQAFLNAPIAVHTVTSYNVGGEKRMENNKVTEETNDNSELINSQSDDDNEETVYVIEFDGKDDVTEKRRNMETGPCFVIVDSDPQNPLDPWSIVWYIGSFGGLVAFFLIVSCSEWCCRRGSRPLTVPYAQRAEMVNAGVAETPPPPYHLFAPPPYDSVNYADIVDKTTGEKLDIYVISVPIHRPITQESV